MAFQKTRNTQWPTYPTISYVNTKITYVKPVAGFLFFLRKIRKAIGKNDAKISAKI